MKIAIVTGAGRGIGFAVAESLLEQGFKTVLCARHENEQIEALRAKYQEDVCFLSADISKAEDRARILSVTQEKYGTPYILVNNAGVAPRVRKDMLEINEEDYDYVLDINLKGTYFLTQAVANAMLQNKEGYIVNVGSISSNTVSLNRAEYCMSKAGVHMLTELFATRLAGDNIYVFEVSPGVIATDMIKTVKAKYDALAENGTIPAKRLGSPQDVANMVSAVVNGNLDYCTGSVLHCGGGLHIPTL